MTTSVVLPALDGRQPLGFLAGLGVARLLTGEGMPVRLAWDEVRAQPVLGGAESLDQILDVLESTVLRSAGSLIPGLPLSWLPKWSKEGPDPGRATRTEFGERLVDGPAAWASALWTDLALDKRERCQCTPFYAPMGKQSMRSMFENPYEVVVDSPRERLSEALVSWRRSVGFTGENLDIKALEEAAESQSGSSVPRGVAGATWLAWAALPLFRISGDGAASNTVGWKTRARGAKQFAWPLWSTPLDLDGIAVLLDHPTVAEPVRDDPAHEKKRRERLRALGVFAVVTSVRRQTAAGKSDGILVTESVR